MDVRVSGVRIAGTASLEPGQTISTDAVAARLGADSERLRARTGIERRGWFTPEETTQVIGARVLETALADAGLTPTALRRVILVTSTGGDALIPAGAAGIAAALGAQAVSEAFDLNNACMGFLTALDVAARGVATGIGPTAIVVVERLSAFIAPEEPRSYAVLADAAAAVILVPEGRGGLVAWRLHADATQPPAVQLAHPQRTERRERIVFGASNEAISEFAPWALSTAIEGVLGDGGVTLDAVEHVLVHQPNGALFDRVVGRLGLRAEQTVRVVDTLGSVGAASTAVALDRRRRRSGFKEGQRLLLAAVGAGAAWGASLWVL